MKFSDEKLFKNPESHIQELLELLPNFRDYDCVPSGITPTNVLKAIHKHCELSVGAVLEDIQTLAKFLIVGAQEKVTGIIDESEIIRMGYHMQSVAHLGHALFDLKERARMKLEERHENCEL